MTDKWDQAVSWIEQELGGKVTNVRGQGRWRAAWFFDLEKDGEILPMYFRGHRPGLGKDTKRLVMEMQVMQVLEEHKIPVPHIYGLCPEPEGIVMECKPGRPDLSTLESEIDRTAVLDQYVDALVTMHQIDIEAFSHVELTRPTSSAALGLADIDYWEAIYRKQKFKPEPLIECVLRWLKSHVPENREKMVFLQVDSGQFIFHGNQLSALLDFELSMLGDPMADLAGLRTRHLSEPLGDLSRAYQRYEQATGESIDWVALDYHTARFALMTPMPIAALVAFPPERVNLPQYLGWYYLYSRIPLEIIARQENITLQEPQLPPLKETSPSEFAASFKALQAHLKALHEEAGKSDLAYELDITQRMSTYLRRVDALGADFDAANREELGGILGKSVDNWLSAWQELEDLVLVAEDDRLPELVNFFYRYTQRHLYLLGPALRELEGAQLQYGKSA